MTQSAIIPERGRLSALMPSALKGEPGFTLQTARAENYYAFAQEHPTEGASLSSVHERPLIKRHGIAVLMEIFDALRVNVKFTATSLVGELCTLQHLSPKSQLCILSAVLRWATARPNPQVRKSGGFWLLRTSEEINGNGQL